MTRLAVLRRTDPVGAVVALTSGVVFLLHGFHGELTRDLGLYAYAGQQVADGVPPYVGVMNRSGPLAHLVPGLGAATARLVGVDDLLGMRVLFLLLSVAVIWATYVLGRDLFERRVAGVAAAVTVVCLPTIITYAVGGPREKTTMMLLVTWGLVAMLHRRFWWSGVLVALATLTWQPVFFPAVVAALLCALVAPRGERLRAVVAVVGGGAVVTALMLAYFAAVGAVSDFADGFVLIHLRYTYQPGLGDDLRNQWEGLLLGFQETIWIVLAGLVALLVLGGRNLLSPTRRADPRGRTQIAFALALLVGLAWSWRVFNGWADALMLVPFAAVGIGAVVGTVAERLPARVTVGATGVWVLVTAVIALDFSLAGGSRLLDKQEREVDGFFALLPPDATLLSVEAPQPLVLTGRTNLTQHQMFRAGLVYYVDDSWPGGIEGYAATVSADAPDVIAVGLDAYFAWVRPILADDYTEVGTSPGWTWFVRKETPPDVLLRMQEAVSG
ncbi:MAG: hypothetical protein ABIR82_01430 [Nocardioides sp.]